MPSNLYVTVWFDIKTNKAQSNRYLHSIHYQIFQIWYDFDNNLVRFDKTGTEGPTTNIHDYNTGTTFCNSHLFHFPAFT